MRSSTYVFDVNGVGFVVDYSGKHAYNAILVSESGGHLEVVGVEPQNDRWALRKLGHRCTVLKTAIQFSDNFLTMIAIIPCAGRGTRRRPETEHTPKILLEHEGQPLIEHIVRPIDESGRFDKIVFVLS